MKLYTAAVYTNSYRQGQNRYVKLNEAERSVADTCPNMLESYHYIAKGNIVQQMHETKAKVFLDSGAFSAHTLGATIDLPEYCNFILKNMDLWRIEDGALMCSVLDGIGDPLKTWQNQLHMELLGVRPLPCFHFGEDERYLEWYVQNYDYITIGGMVGRPVKDLMVWLDRIWEKHMVDHSGAPKLKVHAFGITSVSVMERYPWYSVDSSSWIQAAAFGSIFTAEWGPIAVSSKSPSKHDAGRHISNFTEIEQRAIIELLTKEGFDVERLSEVYESRAVYNLLGYRKLNNIMNAKNDYSKLQTEVQELF